LSYCCCSYRERLEKILVHIVVCLSFGISLLGCSRYIIFEMADYSFASEIKFVPTLYLSTSPAEYYDWEDAMENFLWDRGFESRMQREPFLSKFCIGG
jgi:hypothetical protein